MIEPDSNPGGLNVENAPQAIPSSASVTDPNQFDKMTQFSQMTRLFYFPLIAFIPKLVSCMVHVKPSIFKNGVLFYLLHPPPTLLQVQLLLWKKKKKGVNILQTIYCTR